MSKFGVTKIQSEEGIFHGSARPVKTHVGACQATGVTVGRASDLGTKPRALESCSPQLGVPAGASLTAGCVS